MVSYSYSLNFNLKEYMTIDNIVTKKKKYYKTSFFPFSPALIIYGGWINLCCISSLSLEDNRDVKFLRAVTINETINTTETASVNIHNWS